MKHLFVINPQSFIINNQLDAVMVKIKNHFHKLIGEEYFIYFSRYPRDAVPMIKKYAIRSNQKVRVYAVGGDGILFDCLNGVMGTENTELASLPFGNCNDFIRSFGEESFDLFKDISLQATSPAIPTDVIYCSGNYALNYCTVGLESKSIIFADKLYKYMNKKKPRLSINKSYKLGNLASIIDHDLLNQYYEINVDGKSYDGIYGAISIANGSHYGGGMCPAPDALPDDGLLDIMLIKNINIYKYYFVMTNYTKGKYFKNPSYISHIRGKDISVRSRFPLHIGLDGETYMDSELDVRVCPSAINFVAVNNLAYVNKERRKDI